MSERTESPARRVLLVGWDGADWQTINPLIEKGQMPNLERLIGNGVMGNIASLTPMLSPILWTSIATGKHADKHGILGFTEVDPDTGKVRPVTSGSRKCKAIWNILSERGLRAGVVAWYASHPVEPINGFVVSDRFGHAVGPPDKEWPSIPRSVHPPELLEPACALRVHPGHTTVKQIAPFVPEPGELDPRKDANIRQLRLLLAECATTHAVTTAMMQDCEWDFVGVYYEAIDRFAHAFMEYHPPKMPHVSDEDFARYQDIMTGCYRFHDMMLGRLMQLAGDDTTIILLSDHGFHSGESRPEGSSKIQDGRPVAWHRRHGVLVISGPNIRSDERVYGASLLDIAPTTLWLLGCPVAEDMDGRPLRQIVEQDYSLETVATYETDEASVAQQLESNDDPDAEQQMLARLADLGYIDGDTTATDVEIDHLRNLGQVYAATGRPARAMDQYERVLSLKPDDKGAKIAKASCLLQLGRLDECKRMVETVLSDEQDAPRASLFMGMIQFRRGDVDAALEHMRAAEQADPRMPGIHCQIGNVYLRRRRWADAERAFQQALAADSHDAEAHDGLGVVYRQKGQPALAVQSHMESIALLHYRPQTHINLGLALAEIGRVKWAERAFHVALDMNANDAFVHQCLAELYDRALRDPDKSRHHLELAESIRDKSSK